MRVAVNRDATIVVDISKLREHNNKHWQSCALKVKSIERSDLLAISRARAPETGR